MLRYLKTVWLAAFVGLLPAAPALAQACHLTGTIGGLQSRVLLLSYQVQGKPHVDTIRTVQGGFSFTPAQASDDGIAVLSRLEQPGGFWLWLEPGTVRVEGQDFQALRLSGTPENEAAEEYHRQLREQIKPPTSLTAHTMAETQGREASVIYAFVRTHPARRTSALLLRDAMIDEPNRPAADFQELLDGLTLAVRQSPQGQSVTREIATRQAQPQLGQIVPGLALADTAGIQHSLATYRGGYVLLDFWGHWCHPCLEAMPQVNALHKRYARKLTIIGVAMEGPASAGLWKRAIREHQVPGLQLSELNGNDGPVMTRYNIHAFPTYMLLDASGRLLYQTSDVQELTAQLAKQPGL